MSLKERLGRKGTTQVVVGAPDEDAGFADPGEAPAVSPAALEDHAPGESVLEVDGICASYSSYRALFGVSFRIPHGSIVALLGSNGAGKSTVARVVSGLVTASSGSVTFCGRNVTSLPAYKIARLGMVHVPEGRGIFSSLTVEENLLLSFRQRVPRKSVPLALERAFSSFPVLSERRNQTAGTLSGGQQRILALGRVLATPPRLLIVDELSLGLAPAIVDSVYEALVAIRKTGCAVLVVEQQVDRALAIADSAVLLSHGLVAWSGAADQASDAMERVLGGRLIAEAAEEAGEGGEAGTPIPDHFEDQAGSSSNGAASGLAYDPTVGTVAQTGQAIPGNGHASSSI